MQEVYTLPDTNIAPWKMVVGSWGDYLPFGKPYFLGLLLPVLGGFCALDWGLVGFFSNSIYHLFFWPTRRSNDVNNLWALRSQQNDLFRGPSFQSSEQSVSNVIINDININHSSTSPFIFDHHTCWDQGAFFGVQVVNILNNSSHSRNMWLLVVWNKWASNMKPGERAHGFLCSKKKNLQASRLMRAMRNWSFGVSPAWSCQISGTSILPNQKKRSFGFQVYTRIFYVKHRSSSTTWDPQQLTRPVISACSWDVLSINDWGCDLAEYSKNHL